jgi:tripartite-type tricarboxylate transporter receptor subunit TctC
MRSKIKSVMVLIFSLFFIFCLWNTESFAQDYPIKPIKIVVGSVPGGSPDYIARALASSMSDIAKVAVTVENRPGAGNTTAAIYVGKSYPDGYTLYLGDTSHQTHVVLNDLLPISSITSEPLLLVVARKSSVNSLQELIREVKAHPGDFNYGSSGIGSIHHMAMAVFANDLGLELVHVPYKGSGESVPAVLSGDVSILMTSFTAAGSQIRAGTLKLLAVSSLARTAKFPNIPSLSEVDKGYNFSSETGVLTTAGVPNATHQKLISIIKRVTENSQFIAKFKDTALVINYMPHPQYTLELKKELEKYKNLNNLILSQSN